MYHHRTLRFCSFLELYTFSSKGFPRGIADPPVLSSSTRNGSRRYGSCGTGHLLVKRSRKQLLSTNLRRPIGSPTATSVKNRDPAFSGDFLPIPSVSREQPARNRWDIEIFWEIRTKVQKNEGVDCAIGGRTGTFCKDRAGHALLSDYSTNERSAFIAVPLPFRGDEDRIGGSAIGESYSKLRIYKLGHPNSNGPVFWRCPTA